MPYLLIQADCITFDPYLYLPRAPLNAPKWSVRWLIPEPCIRSIFCPAGSEGAMGLLKIGTPLHWEDSLEHCNYVRLHGIHQFIATYRRLRHLENDRLFYGDAGLCH